jgi:hypothetical protein
MIGDTVKVVVRISNAVNLHSVSTTVRYDTSIVKYLSVSNTGGIINGGWIGNQPVNAYVTDSVIVDQAFQGYGLSVSGNDTLFLIYFKALRNGVSPVTLHSLDMRDPNNNELTAVLDSGHIYIGGITVNAKVFLQGPYITATSLMNTNLNSLNYLPLSQPYNTTPWNYTGTESVPSGFFSTRTSIVDWVMIELRTTADSSSALIRKAALIRDDGMIVDCFDGISPVYISNGTAGNYYIVVYHRNHLEIMSANAVAISGNTPLYDFTTGLTGYYGGDAQLLNTGVYGMYAGDINANSSVRYNGSMNDRALILAILNGNQLGTLDGYYKEDINLNGQVKYNGADNDRAIILSVLGGNQLGIKYSNVP